MATGTKGATKEIGSALTRLCIRHKSIENKLKSLTSCILDTMVNPLQERLEEWKKSVAQLDKDHAKECKKARADIKKAASDTIRLQKKAKKGNKDLQNRLDTALHDVNDKFMQLEVAEKYSIRTALVEERSRFCVFVNNLKPFVDQEISLLTEVTHLQEIMDNLCIQTQDPTTLPPSSEQVILDLKGIDLNVWNFHHLADKPSPPSSPSSLGSRKSSMCSSINSINSSSSGSTNPSHSPGHHFRYRVSSQMSQPAPVMNTARLTSVSSQDSGFTSQDMLFLRPATPPQTLEFALPQTSDNVSVGGDSTPGTESTNSTPSSEQASTPSASSTWTNWPDPPKSSVHDMIRPHTISVAYEKSHARPALSAQVFEPPAATDIQLAQSEQRHKHKAGHSDRPQTVVEEPQYARPATINKMKPVLPPLGPKPKSKAVAPPVVPAELPAYVNMNELANMAAEKHREQDTKDGQITPVNTAPAVTAQEETESQKLQNSLELAEAIRELEASTAALQCVYYETNEAQAPVQGCSGYATMNSNSSSSEANIATDDILEPLPKRFMPERSKYYTLPRNGYMLRAYRANMAAHRPASTAGMTASSRRQGGKPPPPPVRRSSSISTGPITEMVEIREKQSPGKQTHPPDVLTKPTNHHFKHPSHIVHKRSRSTGGADESGAMADGGAEVVHRNRPHGEVNHGSLERGAKLKERSSCPTKPPPAVPLKHARSSESSAENRSHYSTPTVHHRQASLPNTSIYGTPEVAHCHASVVQSLSSKFASINRHDPSGAKSVLKSNTHHYAKSHSDHVLPVTPEESQYARPQFFPHHPDVKEDEFPAPPSEAELVAMTLTRISGHKMGQEHDV